MARKQQPERLEEMYEVWENNPGEKPCFVARLLNLPRSAVTRALPAMEDKGYLLSEDEKGRVWPFRRKKP